MRRVLISEILLLMVLSSLAFLLLVKGGMVTSVPSTPPYISGYRPGEVVTAQQTAERFGVPITHPRNRGKVTEVRMECWTLENSGFIPAIGHCNYYVYYADGWYLWIQPLWPGESMAPDWQAFVIADDTRGMTQPVIVQGQLGIGWGQSTKGDEMDPDGWAGYLRWYDPQRNWLLHLVGPYNLQPLVDIANGPWCTLATPAGVEPPVTFC